jgi:hypothetical protein
MMAPSLPLPRRQPQRRALVAATVVLLLALAERGLHTMASGRSAAPGAQWIWTPEALDAAPQTSFLAVRDLHLETLPAAVEARLLADESYLLYINGEHVGSNSYRLEANLDSYDVRRYLKGGANRIVIEVRSRGIGGGLLFALLGSDSADPLLVSDRDWRILHEDSSDVRDGLVELQGGLEPRVWQSPPTGRWGALEIAESRPTLSSLRVPEPPAATLSPLTDRVVVDRVRRGERRQRRYVDFGREVSGYLVFTHLDPNQPTVRMLTGDERPEVDEPWQRQPLLERQTNWRDSEVRVFRWLRLDDRHPRATVRLIPVDARWALREVELRAAAQRGVFGLAPPSPQPLDVAATQAGRSPDDS